MAMLISQSPAAMRKEFNNRLKDCKSDRERYIALGKEIANFFAPESLQFFDGYRNKKEGDLSDYRFIVDDVNIEAPNVMIQGLSFSSMSENTPWSEILPDGEYEDDARLKEIAHISTDVVRKIFAKSKAYPAFEESYRQRILFGTGLTYIYEDYYTVCNYHTAQFGEYWLTMNDRLDIAGAYRKFKLKTRQMVAQFGLDNVSDKVRRAYDLGNYDHEFTVIHVCDENTFKDTVSVDGLDYPYLSAYYEETDDKTSNAKFLSMKGRKYKPFVCPRNYVAGSNVYGTGVANRALTMARSLLFYITEYANATRFAGRPPLLIDLSLKGQIDRVLPDDLIFGSFQQNSALPVQQLFPMQFNPDAIQAVIADLKQQMKTAFYNDVFLMISNTNNRNVRELAIAEQKEEKLLMLGPLVERDGNEFKDPLIKTTLQIARDKGAVPPLPEGMQDSDLKINYVSKLAQALRVNEMNKVTTVLSTAGNIASIYPDIMDMVNFDEALGEIAKATNAPPNILRTVDEAQAMRQEKAAQAQAQAMMEQAPQMASAAKVLSETDTSAPTSLLSGLLG